MAADEEISGHEIAGEDVNASPILPPTTDPADTCEAYAEIEFAGECIPASGIMYPDLSITGDTCDAYAEIEYAGECVPASAVYPIISSTVEDFDTSAGRLGCGTPLVFITSRCSGSMLCQIDLSDITKIVWTRRLDEVSEAEVEIGITGDASQTCCQCLSDAEPWCHELHIWRDGQEVWVGPIQAIRYERERVTIKATDVLGWLDVRIPNENVDFKTTLTGTITDNPLTSTATTINSAGFASLPAVVASVPTTIIALDPSEVGGPREIVQVTSHTAAATSIVVTRGQQSTTARQHNVGTAWAFGGQSGPESDLTYIAEYLVRTAFEEDVSIGNTCEVNHIHKTLTGTVFAYFQEAFNQTALEILSSLAETELNFTTLGRTIVLSGDTLSFTPLVLLNDEHIMGDIEIIKDGKLMGNRFYVHYDTDEGIPAIGEATQRYCYSLVERVVDGGGIQLVGDAEDYADELAGAGGIAPRTVEIPSGSRLSPDTPWTINQMVPGARVDVAVTRLCLPLTASFLLVGVSVEYSASDGEAVGIELTPLNSVAVN